MKKFACIFAVLFCVFFGAFAQDLPDGNGGEEIPNTVGAVKAANPGDYILLKSGRKYILTKEEIDIANGVFDYEDLSDVKTETREDGTEVKTISEAHTVYVYPDGQYQHILKTGVSFSAFMDYVEGKYHITRYIDFLDDVHDYRTINSPRFDVFRASVQIRPVSNGVIEIENVHITAYNFKGKNFIIQYCSAPDMVWGNISSEGSYSPTGETRRIEFDTE